MIQILSKVLNVSLIYAAFRAATPIIYAALCAAITQQANILNIGTEGIMLVGAFFAVTVSYFTHSWVLAIAAAMLAGIIIAMIMAVGHIKYGADICGIGMGINMLALAITKFLLKAIYDVNGAFSSPEIVPIPKVHLAFLDNVPVLNDLLNNWSLMEWFVIVLIIVLQFFIYKTVWGLRLRAVGQFPEAAKTAGIKVDAVKYRAMAISGLIGGLAGAHLSLGYSNQFIENMTSSRGFMGVAAMYFGGANPVLSSIGCLLFGLADSIGARLQAYGLPSQFVLMMPYIVTIVVLAISMMTQLGNERRRQSSLTGIGTEAAIDK
jgi:simple sugar transport system permease protein